MPDTAPISRAHARYTLAVLAAVYGFNMLDRQILGILFEPIKAEFEASDTAMGLLTGLVFALFYTTAGIPLARLSDGGVRRSVLAGGLAVWSAMTALCGAAQSFFQLALARIGVGIGEATASPASISMIADLYPPERRSTALSIYTFGSGVGVMIALPLGGWLNELYGWRVAFFAVGLPGLLMALVVRLTVREPTRGASDGRVVSAAPPPGAETLRARWGIRSYRHLLVGAGLQNGTLFALYFFTAAFLERVHGMSTGEAGTWLGVIYGGIGALGTLAGGVLADRLQKRDVRWNLWISALGNGVAIPFLLGFLFLPDSTPALLLLGVFAFPSIVMYAPVYALTQTLAHPRIRAMSAALFMFVLNVLGMGVGPTLVGFLSDSLQGPFGDESLRYALLAGAGLSAWSVIHLTLGARTLAADIRAATE